MTTPTLYLAAMTTPSGGISKPGCFVMSSGGIYGDGECNVSVKTMTPYTVEFKVTLVAYGALKDYVFHPKMPFCAAPQGTSCKQGDPSPNATGVPVPKKPKELLITANTVPNSSSGPGTDDEYHLFICKDGVTCTQTTQIVLDPKIRNIGDEYMRHLKDIALGAGFLAVVGAIVLFGWGAWKLPLNWSFFPRRWSL